MDVFILSLLGLVIVMGSLGLREEAQKKEIRNWSERFGSIYDDPQYLSESAGHPERPKAQ